MGESLFCPPTCTPTHPPAPPGPPLPTHPPESRLPAYLPTCLPAYLPTCCLLPPWRVPQVTVNGVKKGGGVYFDIYPGPPGTNLGELRVTSLLLNATTAPGVDICITLAAPCNSMQLFCSGGGGGAGGTFCAYAAFDPLLHTCCPASYMAL